MSEVRKVLEVLQKEFLISPGTPPAGSCGLKPGPTYITRHYRRDSASETGKSGGRRANTDRAEESSESPVRWSSSRQLVLDRPSGNEDSVRRTRRSGTRLCGTTGRCRRRVSEALSGCGNLRLVAASAFVTACFSSGLDLLLRPHVGFRQAHFTFFARNLSLVALR